MKLRTFLIIINLFAISQAMLGFLGVGTQDTSIFGEYMYADRVEDIVHTLVGLLGLIIVFKGSFKAQIEFGYFLAFFALIVGVISAFGPVPEGVYIIGAQLQNPGDTIIHLFSGTITYYFTHKAYKI